MAQLTDRTKRLLLDEGYDLGFIALTQPVGNVKVHSGYIETGSGYATFVDVYRYPHSNLPPFWLRRLANQDHVIALLSITTQNKNAVKPQLDRSITEEQAEMNDPNSRPSQRLNATETAATLVNAYRNISHNDETLKRISLRLLVYDNTKKALLDRVKEIQNSFLEFKMTRNIDEQEYDLHSMYLPMSLQKSMPNHRKGTILQSYDLGGSYMFNYVNLNDPGGNYFGFTPTNGGFVFNPYNLRGNRTRVFSLIAGEPGEGKSVLAQMLNDDAFRRGFYIRNFDVEGEYRQSMKAYHGTIIDTSDTGNRINMFQIFPTVAKNDGSIDEVASFNNNVNKIIAIIHIMNSNLTADDLAYLKDRINKFYISLGMWHLAPQDHPDDLHVIKLPAAQYPTLRLFLNFLHDTVNDVASQRNRDEQQLSSAKRLYRAFDSLEENYGELFDGHTNIRDFQHEPVVDFDMRAAASSSNGSEAQLFQAQFFNYLSMVSAQMVRNGLYYRHLLDSGQKVDDKIGRNIKFYYINIDEAEKYFNPAYPEVVQMIASMMEQMRKNYCAITLVFPTLKDVLMNESSQEDHFIKYHQAVKKIFGLIQYYHLFRLQGDDVDSLRRYFKLNSSISLEQLASLEQLQPHQLLSIIVGERSYQWQTEIDREEQERYR